MFSTVCVWYWTYVWYLPATSYQLANLQYIQYQCEREGQDAMVQNILTDTICVRDVSCLR